MCMKGGRTDYASPGWLGLEFSALECEGWAEREMQLRAEHGLDHEGPPEHKVESWENSKQV